MLACEDFDDLIGLCAEMMEDPDEAANKRTWARLLFDCFEKMDGHNIAYYVVQVDPLTPEGETPSLPELPIGPSSED